MIHHFANPARFQRLAVAVLPWSAGLTIISLGVGLALALVVSPADYQQGQAVRIMYVHVPAAWMAMFVYANMAVAAAVGLVWKHPLADLFAQAAAPIGAGFTALCLITGSLWGEPMWGTWWVWDARLTSVLILFFLYLGYMALRSAYDDLQRADRASAVLALVGVVNVPIIHFSVYWWNSLHQGSTVIRKDGPAMPPSMLVPLLMCFAGFTLLYAALACVRVRAEVLNRERNATWLKELSPS